MKKIDKLISTSFIGPSVLSYFVATFVLVMQFLWKYIDEILGKGLTIFELLELIFYYAVTLIPMAVPITVLISSVMVFGDMAEKYELSSMKSAGISMLRIMVPSIVVAGCIGLFSIFASNFLKPASLLQFNKRFLAIRKQKSTLAIEEGIFNNAFNETVIRVNKIDKDKRGIHDILIYDHTHNDKSLIGLMSAKSGEMYTAEEGRYFVMKLDTGIQYRELEKKSKLGSNKNEIPFMRTYFDQWTKTFDMSQFDAAEGLLNFNRNREDMMNTVQLLKSVDTFKQNVRENNDKLASKVAFLFSEVPNQNSSTNKKKSSYPTSEISLKNIDSLKWMGEKRTTSSLNLNSTTEKNVSDATLKIIKLNTQNPKTELKKPTSISFSKKLIKQIKKADVSKLKNFAETIDSADYREVLVKAQTDLSAARDELVTLKNANEDYNDSYQRYMLRLNQHYSWAMICVVFLFIGAPLGSIIRKGGYGYPLLVAILFYMIFIITTILGEKLVRNESMSGILAGWLPCLILSPFAILLTIMALRDIKFNPVGALEFFYKLRLNSKSKYSQNS